MRVHIKTNIINTIIPFDHQHQLVGTVHKWLGWNGVHGKISLYSFSWLEGGKATRQGLHFENGAFFFFSSFKIELLKKLISGIQSDPSIFCGLTVSDIIIEEDPNLSNRELFYVASPILIKRRSENGIDHIIYNETRANACLKETLVTKLKEVGLSDDSFDILFESNYPNAGTKKITYKGIENKANWCPVVLKAKTETKLFAWNVGLGNSTGIGFGAIK